MERFHNLSSNGAVVPMYSTLLSREYVNDVLESRYLSPDKKTIYVVRSYRYRKNKEVEAIPVP